MSHSFDLTNNLWRSQHSPTIELRFCNISCERLPATVGNAVVSGVQTAGRRKHVSMRHDVSSFPAPPHVHRRRIFLSWTTSTSPPEVSLSSGLTGLFVTQISHAPLLSRSMFATRDNSKQFFNRDDAEVIYSEISCSSAQSATRQWATGMLVTDAQSTIFMMARSDCLHVASAALTWISPIPYKTVNTHFWF